jgi:hypothetical protein
MTVIGSSYFCPHHRRLTSPPGCARLGRAPAARGRVKPAVPGRLVGYRLRC